jgi:UDP-N-acetylmuramoyl-L-alanyl-D-glutamate--2,6-diaminopimelate ligase
MPTAGSTMGTLAALVAGELSGDEKTLVLDATHDSRTVVPGTLYVAVPGARFDGHDFVAAAVGNGAAGLCVSRSVVIDLPTLLVADTRRVMGRIAAEIQGHPSAQAAVVGVTGTNGKTTVTFMLEAIAKSGGRVCGLIGTVATRIGSEVISNPRTTPEATDFQRLLRTMVDRGADLMACEVSSHALALGRVDGTHFEVGAFTNLSQDHLDFHQGMEEYFEAKALLIERSAHKVIWVNDEYGSRLAARHPDALLVGWDAEVRASSIQRSDDGTRFRLHLPDGDTEILLHLEGRFNVANALVAAACAHLVGFGSGEVAAGLEALPSVPGRFEVVMGGRPVTVVVDYAHTPEGIATVIATARGLTRGRVLAVFGAGGDRDRSKRPEMGRAASAADVVVVTSDNPRSEHPDSIIDEVMAGVDHPAALRVTDRRRAIHAALEEAAPGDLVVVLGKGHESSQEIAGVIHPFDDRQVVEEEWAAIDRESSDRRTINP